MNKEIIDLSVLSDDDYQTPQSIKSDKSQIKDERKLTECKQNLFLSIDLTSDTPDLPLINANKTVKTKRVETPQSLKPSNSKSSSKKKDSIAQGNTLDTCFRKSASIHHKTVSVANIHAPSANIKLVDVKKCSEYDEDNVISEKVKSHCDIPYTKVSNKMGIKSVLFVPTTATIYNKLTRWIKEQFLECTDSFKNDIENEDSPFASIQSIFLESFRHICQYTEAYDCITVMKAITVLTRALNVTHRNSTFINHYGFQVADLLVSEYNEKYAGVLIHTNAIQTQQLSGINTALIGLLHSLKWIRPYDSSRVGTQTTYVAFDLMKQWIDNSIFAINNDNYTEAIRLLGRLQCIGSVSHSIPQPFTDAINLLYKAIKLYRTINKHISLIKQRLILTLSRVITKLANEVYFICELQHQRNYTDTALIQDGPILQKRGRNRNMYIVEFAVVDKALQKRAKKIKATKVIDDGIKASIYETFQKFDVLCNMALIEQKEIVQNIFILLELQDISIKEVISIFNIISSGHNCDILINALKYYATTEKHYPNQQEDINSWYLHSLASSVFNKSNKLNPEEIEYLYQQAAENKSNHGSMKLLHYIFHK